MAASDLDIPAKVVMISGCMDEQTSADVSDVMSFGLPADVGPGGAGGACTSAMANKLTNPADRQWKWGDLLMEMRKTLKEKKYTQVPQLSASYLLNLQEIVHLKPPNTKRNKALMIGINYVGHAQGVLSGCHNDVEVWRDIITQKGFDNITTLKDDGRDASPTCANIKQALQDLVRGAQEGDALFLQYSGHGSQVKDTSGDEVSGFDQVLVPVDYNAGGGVILDDWILDNVVKVLPAGVSLFCVMDCCHSGSIMDLPHTINCDAHFVQEYALAMVAAAGAAGCCLGGPIGCMMGMCAAVCGMAAADQYKKNQASGGQGGQV